MISRLIAAAVCCVLWPPLAVAQVSCSGWDTGQFFAKATAQDVARCIAAGADPGARFTARGITPLHLAARASKTPSVVTTLLDAGATPDARRWLEEHEKGLALTLYRYLLAGHLQAEPDAGHEDSTPAGT